MPIYEYICNYCKKTFEYLLRNQNEEISCPYCHRKDIKRKFSKFSFGSKDRKDNLKMTSSSKCSSCTSRTCSSCF
ncbi:MAG: zinc ribbon domain-containing protein [Candidatus Omnitrophica bacterium]|nr:zinc ribbon domain-containing protein [Candidatus Omnitrophota bacterium]MCM8800223.1 zinc ribbon domain-containing protein [Candidatus Omnitrophota bacterium]